MATGKKTTSKKKLTLSPSTPKLERVGAVKKAKAPAKVKKPDVKQLENQPVAPEAPEIGSKPFPVKVTTAEKKIKIVNRSR